MRPPSPSAPPGSPEWLEEAIRDGGGHLVGARRVRGDRVEPTPRIPRPRPTRSRGADLRWVQLPFAGIENFVDHRRRRRTRGRAARACTRSRSPRWRSPSRSAGLRNVGRYARATTWSPPAGRNLLGGRVTILGGGGITESLVRLLRRRTATSPWSATTPSTWTASTTCSSPTAIADALAGRRRRGAGAGADPGDRRACSARDEFEMMENHAWIVNVARGGHIITDDLVEALQNRHDRRRRARRHRSRAAARRAPALVAAELHHHAARRQHARDGQAAAGEAGDGERASISHRAKELLGLVDVEAGY